MGEMSSIVMGRYDKAKLERIRAALAQAAPSAGAGSQAGAGGYSGEQQQEEGEDEEGVEDGEEPERSSGDYDGGGGGGGGAEPASGSGGRGRREASKRYHDDDHHGNGDGSGHSPGSGGEATDACGDDGDVSGDGVGGGRRHSNGRRSYSNMDAGDQLEMEEAEADDDVWERPFEDNGSSGGGRHPKRMKTVHGRVRSGASQNPRKRQLLGVCIKS